jgi:hypothetical protein
MTRMAFSAGLMDALKKAQKGREARWTKNEKVEDGPQKRCLLLSPRHFG